MAIIFNIKLAFKKQQQRKIGSEIVQLYKKKLPCLGFKGFFLYTLQQYCRVIILNDLNMSKCIYWYFFKKVKSIKTNE